MPVVTIATFLLLHSSIDFWSLMDPPGCMIAVIPASAAISTQSGKGKKASLAITAPCRSKLNACALVMACLRASTLDVCPTPLAHSCLFLANTIALDLECLTILLANSRSSISSSVTILLVAGMRSYACLVQELH